MRLLRIKLLRMIWSDVRRMLFLVMALVLAVGLVAHGFAGPVFAKSVMAAASSMSSANSTSTDGKCNGCAGDEKGLASPACTAFCSACVVLPTVDVTPFAATPIKRLRPQAAAQGVDWIRAQEPYPPKTLS